MDFLLKQRLVGAIVLVALGVIFIPMLLEGPEQNLVPKMQPLPQPDERDERAPLEAMPVPGGVAAEPDDYVVQGEAGAAGERTKPRAVPPGEIPLALPEPPAQTEPETTAQPVPEPQPQPDTLPPAAEPAPAAGSGDPGPLGNWVVQVGSFSSESNALGLRDKLRAGGFATQVEKVTIADKAHFRVRVGPYLERAEADADLNRLAESFSLKGRVLSYP